MRQTATVRQLGARILVVDDLPSDTRLLKRFLEGTNKYVVREENDAIAALEVQAGGVR